MDSQYHYYAFISYKREDEKWAKWLQTNLEHYSIPANIRKEIPRLPKHIRPVFRDKTDLGAGGLTSSLQKELECSRFLIVICSPHSAKSDWVRKEIEYFRNLGREEQIIPFIVDGIPHSEDTSRECFHPIFNDFQDEPLGINVKEIGRQKALVKVLARILDLRYDALYDRINRHNRKKRINFALSTLLFCCIGLLYWYYTKPIYKYYADYVDKWGIPEGVIELDESVLKHRYRSYRFEYRRIPIREDNALSWRLSEVAYINSSGQVENYPEGEIDNRYAIMQLEYNSSGTIKHIDLCNKFGKVLLRWKVSSKDGVKAALIDFLGTTDIDASGYLGAYTTKSINPTNINSTYKSSIKRYVIERDNEGYIISISYHSSNADNIESSKTTNANGVYKQVFSNDSMGRVLHTAYYDINGKILNGINGIAIKIYEYDSWGNNSNIEYYNSEKIPVLNEQHCARITTKCDKWGNVIEKNYYGVDGTHCFNTDKISQEIIEYDNNGFPKSVSYYDDNHRLCNHKNGYAKLVITCDNRGNQIENRYEDLNGRPCTNKDGIAKIYVEYDRWGKIIHESYYKIGGSLVRNVEGVAGNNYRYNRFGDCIQVDCFDVDWNACSNNMGFATLKIEYDNRGYPKKYTLYDVKGEKTLGSGGFASVKYHFNERGNPDEFAYFNVEDMPCIHTGSRVHKVKNSYDDLGNLIEVQFYDITGNLCETNEYFASYKAFPDDIGNIKRLIYYDILGNPTKDINGVCDYRWQFDKLGRITQVRFFDEEGNPIKNKNGVAGWNSKYNSRGNLIEQVNIGPNGGVCCDTLGIAMWKKEFDQRGNQTSFIAYDINNSPISYPNGVASWKSEFNNRGFLLNTRYFDENGNPCMNPDVGYSYYETAYNVNMDQIEVCTYDEKGNLCVDPKNRFARWLAKYDESGNKIEMLSYSNKDSLCVCNFGYARWIAKYSKDGDFIESFSYDENGGLIKIQKSQVESNNNTNETRKYDSHKFRYDTPDIIFGVVFFIVFIIVLTLWIRYVFTNTIKENLLCIVSITILMGFDYCFLRNFLLHYSLLPYDIYNNTWILCFLSALFCTAVAIVLLYIFVIGGAVQIFRNPKSLWLSKFKEIGTILIISSIAIVWFLFAAFYIAGEGWIIYSNPL